MAKVTAYKFHCVLCPSFEIKEHNTRPLGWLQRGDDKFICIACKEKLRVILAPKVEETDYEIHNPYVFPEVILTVLVNESGKTLRQVLNEQPIGEVTLQIDYRLGCVNGHDLTGHTKELRQTWKPVNSRYLKMETE